MENEPRVHKQSEAEDDSKNVECVHKRLFSPSNSNNKPLTHAKDNQVVIQEYCTLSLIGLPMWLITLKITKWTKPKFHRYEWKHQQF